MQFPQDFVWGAATASYQIEGGPLANGRGECIWHRFSHTEGNVLNGDTGDVACDHYNRYRDDVGIMRDLGLRGYRFSTSWPRVLPTGTVIANPAGLDFYSRLVDALLEAKIRPFLTLYHWDLPQALQDRGGWDNPDCIDWYCEYADLMTRTLGDRVKDWITINEPHVVAFVGNLWGVHAPGIRDVKTAYRVAHHVLLAHGKAVPLVRRNVPDARVGMAIDLEYYEPLTDSEADIAATRREDGFKNRWFLDPLFRGEYPADMVAWLGDALDGIDLSAVSDASVPTDFLGINYYQRVLVSAGEEGLLATTRSRPETGTFTAMGWEAYPDGLRNLLLRVTEEYGPAALYITENGAAYDEPAPTNGVVEDPGRVDYLRGHVAAVGEAVAGGAPVAGYFVWSLLDNFEWSFGYDKRFGIVHVDYATQQRTLKRSAHVYREMITG